MEIKLTAQEIISHPNDYSLGEYVRKKYWDEVNLKKSNRDEHVTLQIDENGMVTALGNTKDGYEICVECGMRTNTLATTSIDYRTNYIEGAGQACDGSCGRK